MKNTNTDLENQIFELTSLRNCTGLNRTAFAKMFGIPIRTVEDWESGRRKMPNYLLKYKPQWFAGVPTHYEIIANINGRTGIILRKFLDDIDYNDLLYKD